MTGYRDISTTDGNADGTAAFEHGQGTSFAPTSKGIGFLGFDGPDLGSHRPTEGRVPAFYALAKRAGTGGRYVENAASVADALRQTGLDFEVRHETISAQQSEVVFDGDELVSRPTGDRLALPAWMATVAYPKDGGQPFAIAPTSKRYPILQTEDALAIGDAISEGKLVAVGAYGNPIGAKVYAAYELGEGMEIAGDPYRNYLTITTTHDRSGGLSCLMAPIRLGCTNQTTATFGRAVPRFTIRHVGNMDARIAEARRILGLSRSYIEVYKEKAEELLTIKMTKDTFLAYEHKLFAVDEETSKPRALALAKTRDEELLSILGSQTCQFGEGTAYAGFQALVEWADFASPVRGKGDARDQARAEKVLDGGRLDLLKTRAYDLAAALA